MSLSLGQTLAGLLNATFGNVVEIIVGITALMQDQIRIVQTSVRAFPRVAVSDLMIPADAGLHPF